MDKMREVLCYCLLLLSTVTVCYYYWDLRSDAKAAEEIKKMVEEWVEEGPHSTIIGKMRGYLPWWKMADPLQECGIKVDPAARGWLDYLIKLRGAKNRLLCLKQHIHEAKEDHLEFTRMMNTTLMVTGVVFLLCMSWAIKVYVDNIFRIKACSATPLPGLSYDDLLLYEDLPDKENQQEEEQTPKQSVRQTDIVKHTLIPHKKRKSLMDTVEIGHLNRPLTVSLRELLVSGNLHSDTFLLNTRPDQAEFSGVSVAPSRKRKDLPLNQQVTLVRRDIHLRYTSKSLISGVRYGSQPKTSIQCERQQDAVDDILSLVPISATGRGIRLLSNTPAVTREQVMTFMRFAGRFIVDFIVEGTHPQYW